MPTDQKVIRFDVSVNDAFFVTLLDPLHHLEADHAASFEIELVSARLEQVLEALAQQLHDHHVKLVVRYRLVCSDVVKLRDLSYRKEEEILEGKVLLWMMSEMKHQEIFICLDFTAI
jgi:hypothetical protein